MGKRVERTQEQNEKSPVEYVHDREADGTERFASDVAAQVRQQSGNSINHIKEKQRIKREVNKIQTELREGRISEQGERPSFSPTDGEKVYQPKEQCGYLESGVMPKFSLCSDGVKWFQSKGQFKDGSYVLVAGNIIFFDWGDDGSIDHVGIVESVSKGNVNTIEGNSGDAVRRRSYRIGDNGIYGYGVY